MISAACNTFTFHVDHQTTVRREQNGSVNIVCSAGGSSEMNGCKEVQGSQALVSPAGIILES